MMPMGCGGMWGSQLVVLNEVWGEVGWEMSCVVPSVTPSTAMGQLGT